MNEVMDDGVGRILTETEGNIAAPRKLVDDLGFSSNTHYQFVHFVDIERDYNEIIPNVSKEWSRVEQTYDQSYFHMFLWAGTTTPL